MTPIEILDNLRVIHKAIDQRIPSGDIDSLEGKMLELVSLMGLSAEVCKEAKQNALISQGHHIEVIRRTDPGLNATTMKLLLESKMAEELSLLEYSDRLNRALVHSVDGIRTAISKYKAERELSAYGK